MFAGSSRVSIDEKGRFAVPARARTQLADDYGKQVAITLGPDCIEIYPSPVFRQLAEQIQKMPDRNKRLIMQRLFIGHAVECELDGQGRVLVPPMLRERLKLGSEAVLVGLTDHFELWPESQWTSSTDTAQVSYADAFAALGP